MAKKKTGEPKKDRHTSGFVVRLPKKYQKLMGRLKDQNRRPITSEVTLALDVHLKANGIDPDSEE